jgi:dihydrofolate reductase
MADVILYIASSLDGYIADHTGGVEWLDRFNQVGEDYGYGVFLEGVGTLLMGARTYRQVRGFGDWPYRGKRTIVFTHGDVGSDAPNGAVAYSGDLASLLERLRANTSQDIWLVGGSELIAQAMAINAIDEYRIFTMPILLKDGVPLFGPGITAVNLDLKEVNSFRSGAVELRYRSVRQAGRSAKSGKSAG